MGNKIYVGNLPYGVSSEDLSEAFGKFGAVESAKVITDRDTNRSKGFGFVEMNTDESATEAISNLDGTELGGRQMKVSEAKPQAPRENRGGYRG